MTIATQTKVNYDLMSDSELKEYISTKVQTDNQWLRRAVVEIYERQTLDEQRTDSTNHHNSLGFTGADAHFLSSIAKIIIEKRYSLTEKQLNRARSKMAKYSSQLVKIVRKQL